MGPKAIEPVAEFLEDLAVAWFVGGFITPVVEQSFDRARPFNPTAGFCWILVSVCYLAGAEYLVHRAH